MPPELPAVHRDAIVVVGHTDIVASDVDWRRESGETKVMERRHLPTLRAGGATVICDHVGGDARYGYLPATRLHTTPLQRFMRALDHTFREIEESDSFILATTVADIRRAKREGKVAFVLCLEGAMPLENEISYLRNFHRLGLRCLGLTHDMRNPVADGVRERGGGGLTHFGVEVVRECNRLGIVVDVSHMSDRGTLDTLEASSQPIVASHSNARAICGHPRNLTDEMIRGIAKGGGVIGFHALNSLVGESPEPSFDDLMRHIVHIVEVGGIDCVAIGPDLMENWDPDITLKVNDRSRTLHGVPVRRMTYKYPQGMASLAEIPNLTRALQRLGFGDADIAKFLGGNWLRVFEAVWRQGPERP
ncbi:MAG: membrane dipeptidase [Proteobacteria bacterium]|nr:membrane dipeptidase [Pseudomonadota bacterium]